MHASDLAEAERALTALVDVDLEDHLTFRLIRSTPTGLGENQPGVATWRYSFACIDADHDTQVDTRWLSMSSSGRRLSGAPKWSSRPTACTCAGR